MVHRSEHRNAARSELLRRHAPLIASHVVRCFNRGVGGSELGDYESLAVTIALQAYDEYDPNRAASPSSYMFGLVLRRLLDAQRRTSLESDCRWPIRKFQFRAWLNGDYDHNPEFRKKFEIEHGVTEADRAEMIVMYSHLLHGHGVYVAPSSLDASPASGSLLNDSGAASEEVIINRVLIEKAFSSLNDDVDRQVLHLFAVEDRSMVEISKELKLPLPEVRKRIKRSQAHCVAVLS
jgi:RNA polymerase sigma factor (sigma-70 family)